jgi:WD40 repeat protein
VRIFLSFNSRDTALAEAVRAGLSRIEPTAQVFFSPVSLGAGFWLPKLAEEIAESESFLLLIGPSGKGPWQEVEYFTAFDRHVKDKSFALVPAVVAGAEALGLPFLRTLNLVEAPVITEDKVLHRLLAALRGESVASATPLWKLVNPYRGLEAMNEANADYFYGRDVETAAVLNALASKPGRCPILIGASGVGKSSVAQAGVLSALKSMRWPGTEGSAAYWPKGLQNSRSWVSLTMRPGEAPLEALAAAITRLWQLDAKDPDQAALPRKWAKGLSAGDNTLADLVDATQEELKSREGQAPERILLYVDQGEELYTRAGQTDARRFSEVLAEGLGDSRLRAFGSLRADYFDRLQADEPLFKCHEHVNVPPLDRAQLHEVVTAPARALGVRFENDEVANGITAAASAEPGALPLLSYLLTDMWAGMVKRGDATLRMPVLAIDIGGVLASRAEEFLKANPNEERALRRLLTLRLAMVPSEGEPVRRQTTREECMEAEWSLAARLAEHPWRLVVMGEREVDKRVVAEVAHEALLRAWPRLADWLREERDFLVCKGDTERAQRRWLAMGQVDKALLTGFDLARSEESLVPRSEDLSPEVTAFVQRSIAADRAAKERQLQLQRRVSIGAVAAALLMAIIGGLALFQWSEAARERDNTAQARDIAARERDNATSAEIRVTKEKQRADRQLREAQTTQSLFLADLARQQRAAGDAGSAVLLALEALPDDTAGIARPYVPEPELQLDGALRDLRERLVLKGLSAAFSPDGKRIVTASADKTARVWDADTGKPIGEPLTGHTESVFSAEFSPNGKRIVTASKDKTARIWDVDAGKAIGEPLRGHTDWVFSAEFNPNGKRIVTVSGDKTARIWDADTGKPIGEPLEGHTDVVWSAAFSPDGKRIVTVSDDILGVSANKTARIWDAETGKPIGEPLQGHTDWVLSAAFSPDGKRIVTASSDKTARLWNAENGKPIGEPLRGHEGALSSVAFSPDGKRIVTASSDKTARLWNAENGKPIGEPLKGHEGALSSARFSPDGRRIVTASGDWTVRLWDAETGKPIGEPLTGHTDRVFSAAFSPDGKRIVTVSGDKTVRVWDAETDEQIGKPLQGHTGWVLSAAFSLDGKRIVTASRDWTARLWDAETGKQIGEPLRGHTGRVLSAAFNPDGKRIVTASEDTTALLWDADTGKPIGEPLKGHAGGVNSAAFSPGGKRIVTASWDKTARLWDAETGKQIVELDGHADSVQSAAFSADGKRIVTASADKTARVWDAETGKPVGEPLKGHAGAVVSAAFSPDGRRIVTASEDETARLWDVETSKPIITGWEGAVLSAAFSPDGRRIVTVSKDKTARLWDAETGKPIGEPLEGHTDWVVSAAFSPDGKRIVTASADTTARLWEISANTQELVSHAQAAVPRCLTPAQRRAFFLPPEPPLWCVELEKWPYHTDEWNQWLSDTRAGKNPPLQAAESGIERRRAIKEELLRNLIEQH